MANRNIQSCLIGEFLQFQFPQPQPPPVAPTAVGGDQNRPCIRIDASAFPAPPSANGGHGKTARVMVGSHIDKTSIAPDVLNTIRRSARNRSEEHTSELQSHLNLVCRLL